LEKAKKSMESKIQVVDKLEEEILDERWKDEEKPVPKKSTRRRASLKPAKLVVPEHIKVLFDSLDKSISSAWGVQKNGKIKWDAKYNMWLVFKEYFKELSD
ncbi:hypothetical protein LCGC14_1594790, partial [marine sediment metagenome]